jgi:hypothetical protein
MNILAQMFEDAWYILFPKPAKKYNRDRLGRFSIKDFCLMFAGDFKGSKRIKFQEDRRIVFYE